MEVTNIVGMTNILINYLCGINRDDMNDIERDLCNVLLRHRLVYWVVGGKLKPDYEGLYDDND